MTLGRSLPVRTLLAAMVMAVAMAFSSTYPRADCTIRVTLLQLNDVCQFIPVDQGTRGGLARVMTLKKEVEKESPNPLFLLAGDTISPSVESITYKGAQMIE